MGKKGKSSKRIKQNLTCTYCIYFNTSRDRAVNETDDKERYSRYCSVLNKRVLSDSIVCNDFDLYKYFWCNSCGYRLSVESCINREHCHCISSLPKNCKQRKLIEKYVNTG